MQNGALGQDHSTDRNRSTKKQLPFSLHRNPQQRFLCFSSWGCLWDSRASLAGAEVTFPSHWKCRVATDKLTCRGISRCSFRLLQTQQLEHAWALPHKGALWRRPINLPKASKKQKRQCGPLSLVPGARRTGVLGRLCGVSLGPGSNRWGWDKGTGWCTCAL